MAFVSTLQDALVDVANHFISDVELPKDHRGAIVKHIVSVHMSVTDYSEKCALSRNCLFKYLLSVHVRFLILPIFPMCV